MSPWSRSSTGSVETAETAGAAGAAEEPSLTILSAAVAIVDKEV